MSKHQVSFEYTGSDGDKRTGSVNIQGGYQQYLYDWEAVLVATKDLGSKLEDFKVIDVESIE